MTQTPFPLAARAIRVQHLRRLFRARPAMAARITPSPSPEARAAAVAGPAPGPCHGILDAGPERLPSNFCCLNFGCENPEVCDAIGKPCGYPGEADEWARQVRTDRPDLLQLARA